MLYGSLQESTDVGFVIAMSIFSVNGKHAFKDIRFSAVLNANLFYNINSRLYCRVIISLKQ